MKLVINYDFFNAVRNVNEPLTPMKIVRNDEKYLGVAPAIWGVGYLFGANWEYIARQFIIVYGIYMTTDLIMDSLFKKLNNNVDFYAQIAIPKLKKLSKMLGDINIKTTYDMLLQAELYEKQYKIEKNSDKSIALNEKKYIYIPSYGFDGKEKDTSILQEHDIGTGIYTLSVGEPEKQYRRVLVNNHA